MFMTSHLYYLLYFRTLKCVKQSSKNMIFRYLMITQIIGCNFNSCIAYNIMTCLIIVVVFLLTPYILDYPVSYSF